MPADATAKAAGRPVATGRCRRTDWGGSGESDGVPAECLQTPWAAELLGQGRLEPALLIPRPKAAWWRRWLGPYTPDRTVTLVRVRGPEEEGDIHFAPYPTERGRVRAGSLVVLQRDANAGDAQRVGLVTEVIKGPGWTRVRAQWLTESADGRFYTAGEAPPPTTQGSNPRGQG